MNSVEFYLIATVIVVIVFIFILKKVFSELDNAGDFVQAPNNDEIKELSDELDDYAASEFVRGLIRLYEEFNAPNKEITLQLQALLNANSKQIQAMLVNLLPKAEASIKEASGEEAAAKFYESAGDLFQKLKGA